MRRALLGLVFALAGVACAHSGPSPSHPNVPAATFSPRYQADHRGRILVETPEVYEMVNVAIALTDYTQAHPGRVAVNNEYYPRVIAHFPRDHALVRALNDELQRGDLMAYISLRLNAYAFEFDQNGRIIRSPVYDRIGDDGPNALAPLMAEMQSFAEDTDFRAFYAANREFYDSQVSYLRQRTDVEGMWQWLRERFPGVRPYDGVKIILSPLAGDVQNLATFESNGYREVQPHINFPYTVRPELSEQGLAVWRGTLLFGELNHGFVNPTSERYAEEIDAAIASRDYWTSEANAAAYPDDLALFNEYMNFGLIVLYHGDRMEGADRAFARQRIDQVMVEARGFYRFREFSAFLADLYGRRAAGQSIEDLYPQIIAWFSEQQSQPERSSP